MRECLRGSEAAWAALLEKYKNLIFSIPVKQGMARDDAAEIFQRVCLLLLAELKHLRQPAALPMWLIRVTTHECLRWRRQEQPYAAREAGEAELALAPDEASGSGAQPRAGHRLDSVHPRPVLDAASPTAGEDGLSMIAAEINKR